MVHDKRRKVLSVLVGALASGAYWAGVRPSGYGCGPSLGLLLGFYWLLLVYFTQPESRFPTRNLYVLLVFVIGFSIGGMQGYGQYNQWIKGMFHYDIANDIFIDISPAVGFLHLFTCGLTWGGFPALLLAWIMYCKNDAMEWITRVALALGGYFVVQLLLQVFPQLFLPFYNTGIYSDLEGCPDCQRTMDTAGNTWGYFGAFMFLAIYTLLRNKQTRRIILPISLGFAVTFGFGGFLHRGNIPGSPLEFLPWWKFWEYACGFGGGLSVFITFWHVNQAGDIKRSMQRHEHAKPVAHVAGFWVPLFVALGELGRDRLYQAGKLLFKVYGIDHRDAFQYAGYAFIAVVVLLFLWKLRVQVRDIKLKAGSLDSLFITNPTPVFVGIYVGFYELAYLSWIRAPFTLLTFTIPILTASSVILSLILLQFVKRSPGEGLEAGNTMIKEERHTTPTIAEGRDFPSI